MKRKWLWLMLAIPHLFGCVFYAFPTLSVVPPVAVGAPADEVHAFRVEVTTKHGQRVYDAESNRPVWGGRQLLAFSRIPLRAGCVPPQGQAGFGHGAIIVSALSHHFVYHDGMYVRLYRPGYQLVEIKSWRIGQSVEWRPVNDAAEREQVLDSLFAASAASSWQLQTGGYSEDHQQALLFGAQEYERLTRLVEGGDPLNQQARSRLFEKARRLRDLANNPAPHRPLTILHDVAE